jgi:hypothetical protein
MPRHVGTAYLMARQPEKAVSFLERALELSPNSVAVMNDLVKAYRGAGMAEKAEAMSRRIAEAEMKISDQPEPAAE